MSDLHSGTITIGVLLLVVAGLIAAPAGTLRRHARPPTSDNMLPPLVPLAVASAGVVLIVLGALAF